MSNDFPSAENPFRSPTAIGVRTGAREELVKVAKYQRGVLFCLLFQILIWAGSFAMQRGTGAGAEGAAAAPNLLLLLLSLLLLIVSLVGVVFVFLLAINVYSTAVGVLLGILSFIPCLGLLILLMVNGKATSILRNNNIEVGFLGADLSQLE